MRMFHSNLNYVNKVLTSEVKKHKIRLSFEEVTNINSLPYDNEEGNETFWVLLSHLCHVQTLEYLKKSFKNIKYLKIYKKKKIECHPLL